MQSHAKLQSDRFSSVVAFPQELEIDENRMSVWIPFADGTRRDGVGDLIEVEGIVLDRHRRNPVVLWEHGKAGVQMPIAIAEDPESKEYKVEIDPVSRIAKGCAYFYRGDNQEHAKFCEQVFHLICCKFIRGGSIGYQVIQANPLPPDYSGNGPPVQGAHLIKTMMLEFSVVTIPANGDTVMKNLEWMDWRERAREVLCMPNICGKSLAEPIRKVIEPFASVGKAWSNGWEGKQMVEVKGVYKVLVKENGQWIQKDESDSFSDAWAFARTNFKGKESKIVGPEGEFPVKAMSASSETDEGALIKPAEQKGLSEQQLSEMSKDQLVAYFWQQRGEDRNTIKDPRQMSKAELIFTIANYGKAFDTTSEQPPLDEDLTPTEIPPPKADPGWIQEVKNIRMKHRGKKSLEGQAKANWAAWLNAVGAALNLGLGAASGNPINYALAITQGGYALNQFLEDAFQSGRDPKDVAKEIKPKLGKSGWSLGDGKSINVRYKQKVVKGYANVQLKFDVSGMGTKQQNEFVKEMRGSGFGDPSGGKWTGEGEEKALDAPLKTASYQFDLDPGKSVAEAIGSATKIGEKHGAKYMGNAKSIGGVVQTKGANSTVVNLYHNAARASKQELESGLSQLAGMSKEDLQATLQGMGMRVTPSNGAGAVRKEIEKWIRARSGAAQRMDMIELSGANMGQTKGANMNRKTKSAEQVIEEVAEVKEQDNGREFHLQESLGSQVMKRFHEDFSKLMKDYDEVLPVLDHPEVKGFLEENLKGWDKLLTQAKKSHKKWFKDAEGIDDGFDEDGGMEEGEEYEGKDHLPSEIDNATPADSGEVEEPTPNEAVEGMEKEGDKEEKALRREVKSIRQKYRGKGIKSFSPYQEDGKWYVHDSDDGNNHDLDLGPYVNQAEAERVAKEVNSKSLQKNQIGMQAGPDDDGMKWFKGLADHHKDGITEAHGFLKELSEVQDGAFNQEHKMKAYLHASNLGKAVPEDEPEEKSGFAPQEQVKDLTEGEADKIKDEMLDQAADNVQKGLKAAVKNAGCYLKEVANGETFGEEQRIKAAEHAQALEEIHSKADDEPPVEDAPSGEVEGGLQTKNLESQVDNYQKQLDELNRTFSSLMAKVG